MDAHVFDALARGLSTVRTRRRLIAAAVGLLAPGALQSPDVAVAANKKPGSCRKPLKRCGKKCVNLASSATNRGACGARCGAGKTCLNKKCCAPDQRCGAACCPVGQTCQAGACVTSGGGGGGETCAETCGNGCCDAASGACARGETPQACGKNGQQCRVRDAGQGCKEQQCCDGDSRRCDADAGCCGEKQCRQGMCCTPNGKSPSAIQPRCCEGQDVVRFSRCCRPLGEACEHGNTCCDGSCNEDRCCYPVEQQCDVTRNDQCCPNLECHPVFLESGGWNGDRCCLALGAVCGSTQQCCRSTHCVNGSCQRCREDSIHCGEWCCPPDMVCGTTTPCEYPDAN